MCTLEYSRATAGAYRQEATFIHLYNSVLNSPCPFLIPVTAERTFWNPKTTGFSRVSKIVDPGPIEAADWRPSLHLAGIHSLWYLVFRSPAMRKGGPLPSTEIGLPCLSARLNCTRLTDCKKAQNREIGRRATWQNRGRPPTFEAGRLNWLRHHCCLDLPTLRWSHFL